MTAPRLREQNCPPPPDRRPPRRGGRSSLQGASAAGRRRVSRARAACGRGLIGSGRALAATALLALSGALALPAQAQTEIWSGTLTVGAGVGSGGGGTSNGYCDANCDANKPGTYGQLSDTDFTVDNGEGTETTYTIHSIRWGTSALGLKNLFFDLNALPLATVSDTWTLQIGGNSFPVADATTSPTYSHFVFDRAYETLTPPADGSMVTVRLTTTPAVTLALSEGSISENGGASTVTVVAAVSPATADDFELSTNRVLSFAENETGSTGSVTITGVDDDVDAADKTVTVSGTVSATSVTDLPPVVGPFFMLVHKPLQPGGAERNPAVTARSLPGLAAGSPTRCAGELCYTPVAIPQSTPSLPARCRRSLH